MLLPFFICVHRTGGVDFWIKLWYNISRSNKNMFRKEV